MENPEKMTRSTSCRGVSFEINPNKTNPFTVPVQPEVERDGRWVWFPWNISPRNRLRSPFGVSPLSFMFQRSTSRASSHYCDLDDEDDEEEMIVEEEVNDIENLKKEEEDYRQHLAKKESYVAKTKQRRESRLSVILLDQGLFTVYKRLFAVCLLLNLLGLLLAATGRFPYARRKAALFSVGNILVLTLCRTEAFLRFVFWLAVKALGRSWVPLRLKTMTTSFLQSLGGIHSGCGVSSIAWLIYALVLTINDRQNTTNAIVAVASTILSLLCLSSLAAFPLVRHLHHNIFERTHRIAGWTALALLWLFIVLTISYNPISKSYHNFHCSILVKELEFWFTLTITFLIILPWTTVKRVAVTITTSSGHAALIKFEGGVKAGLLGRISPSPLSEWHAFGIISDGNKDHMMLAGAVGDFTKSLVSDPPSHLWVRSVRFAGLPYLVNMYQRVVLVATGSGICVFLSFLLQPCAADVCLVWVAKGIGENFGKEIKEMMSGFSKEKVIIHDTAVWGRPNVAEMSIDAAKRWRAEVVIVTSNPKGSRDVVNACKGAGIAAFGPIWDS
ncbi:adenylate-forming reductase 06235-like [Magnolia sinica]|uniref:adenylate-forming reductase 06235-like n=1 Tax=Magnolia sinica TaxID=86752 RepID=UPI002659C884|nr:adenylate-forming reductase 06235-like [Magnolia sinica]